MKKLRPTRYVLQLGKSYRLRAKRNLTKIVMGMEIRTIEKKDEVDFNVIGMDNQSYLCRVLSSTFMIRPPQSISLDFFSLDTKTCTIWEWELDETDLPIFATWKFCCDNFIRMLRDST